METKICTKCKVEKLIDLFYKGHYYCKKCFSESIKQCKLNNPEKYKNLIREWSLSNPEKVRESYKKWKLNNPEKCKNSIKKWRLNNPEKVHISSVKSNLVSKQGLSKETLSENPILVECKSLMIKTKRLCKTS